MDKLKELFQAGWLISGTYDGKYHLVAADNGLGNTKTAIHTELEKAVNELHAKCIEYNYCEYCRIIFKQSELERISGLDDDDNKVIYYMCQECLKGSPLNETSNDEI